MVDLRPNGYNDDDYVGFFEVIALTGAPQSTVSNWIRSERLPYKVYERNTRRYKVADIKAIDWPNGPRSMKGRKGTPGGPALELGPEPIRLYEEGWGIRRLAKKFDVSFGGMHAYLRRHDVEMRPVGGQKKE